MFLNWLPFVNWSFPILLFIGEGLSIQEKLVRLEVLQEQGAERIVPFSKNDF
jgi:hypothetical protein